MRYRILPATALALLLACQPQRPDLAAMKMELNALKRELELLRYQTEELDPRVRFSEQLAMQAIDDREAPFRVDCVGGAFGVVVTRLATLPTHCDEATPVANGYRLHLKIGNPTAGRIDGLTLTLYAGPGAFHGRSERRILVDPALALLPGQWTDIHVQVDGLTADLLADLALRAQFDRISFAGK